MRKPLPLLLAGVALPLAAFAAAAPPAPFGPTPTPAQVRHAAREFYAFVHFTVDTFTDKEWGFGDENPSVFNPSAFNADQIAGALRDAGCTGLILTCKHHDGFCLWPTATTRHNIAASPYKNGSGDMVRDFADATRRAGMEFGVYLSPWDRNSPLYGQPGYVTKIYREQARELLTRYGEIFEFWMDGANGGDGHYGGAGGRRVIDRSRYYAWPETWAMIRALRPGIVLFSDVGPDIRWCGNERGYALDPHYPTYTPKSPDPSKPPMPGFVLDKEGEHGHRDGKHWMPAEVNVSIRPGWFWHETENSRVRSPSNLMDIYMKSVGLGATFLLNAPPDRRGLLHENDVESLRQFGAHLRQTFAVNLAAGATASPSNVRGGSPAYAADKLLDADRLSAWVTDDDVRTPEVTFALKGEKTFNLIRLREDIRLGRRVDDVAVDARVNGEWRELASARTVGSCRLWRVPTTTASEVRIRVRESAACPALSDFGLFLEPPFPEWRPPVAGAPAVLAKSGWKVVAATAETPGGEAGRVIDGDRATLWHTHGDSGEKAPPQAVTVDMGAVKTLRGFTCHPRTDTLRGVPDRYVFETSADGRAWTVAAKGEFGNLRADLSSRTVTFPATKARFFRFTATRVLEKNHVAVAELDVLE